MCGFCFFPTSASLCRAPAIRAAIRALAVEITRVGTNLNQLAHIANERRELPRKADA